MRRVERRPVGGGDRRERELVLQAEPRRVPGGGGQFGAREAQRLLGMGKDGRRLEHLDEPHPAGGTAVERARQRGGIRDAEQAAQQTGDDGRRGKLGARVLGEQADRGGRLGV